jgi:hypothetical protein
VQLTSHSIRLCLILILLVNGPIDHTPSTAYEARLKAIIRSLPNPINLYRELKWKDALSPDQQNYFKHPLSEGEIAYEAVLSRESIWERFATMSQVSKLKGSELQVRPLPGIQTQPN